MLVLMTGAAFCGKTRKLLNSNPLIIFFVMTITAAKLSVFAIQFEIRLIVVERYLFPGCFVVATQAIRLYIVFFRYEALMFVLVAVHALLSNVAEMPTTILVVARNTRSGFVRTR